MAAADDGIGNRPTSTHPILAGSASARIPRCEAPDLQLRVRISRMADLRATMIVWALVGMW